MVGGMPGDEKVQHDTGRRRGKFAFEHTFPRALGGFDLPSDGAAGAVPCQPRREGTAL